MTYKIPAKNNGTLYWRFHNLQGSGGVKNHKCSVVLNEKHLTFSTNVWIGFNQIKFREHQVYFIRIIFSFGKS